MKDFGEWPKDFAVTTTAAFKMKLKATKISKQKSE
jgi:hypothetical protein